MVATLSTAATATTAAAATATATAAAATAAATFLLRFLLRFHLSLFLAQGPQALVANTTRQDITLVVDTPLACQMTAPAPLDHDCSGKTLLL